MRHDRITIAGVRLKEPSIAAGLLLPLFAGLDHERLAILYLDGKFAVIRSLIVEGTDTVVLPIRRIARQALASGAHAVVIAHNHPGGDATPSRDDRRATQRLAEALRPLSILLADHIVFAGDGWTSFQAHGWL